MTEQNKPPRFVLNFIRWISPAHLHESIEGDLLEQFYEDMAGQGYSYARQQSFINALRFLHPEIILRNKFSSPLIQNFMLGNYARVAIRNIRKRKLYSFINSFGLSIGIAFCILIYLFLEDEKSFDQFHENKNRIYRIEATSYQYWQPESHDKSRYQTDAHMQMGLAPAIKNEIAEAELVTRYNDGMEAIVKYENKVFTESINYVDADFFQMFSFPLISGNATTLFLTKEEVVITPEVAAKYFGVKDPIGKVLSIDHGGEKLFTVTGVIESPPANSSLEFKMLLHVEANPYYQRNLDQWSNFNTPTFVQLKTSANPDDFVRNLNKVRDKYMGEELNNWRKEGSVPEEIELLKYGVTPLSDWHLKKEINWHKVSDPVYATILGGIAVLILLIACINYILLALTTSASRSKEVGIRKTVGAVKGQLFLQFNFESILLVCSSTVLAFVLAVCLLPYFNDFTDKGITLTPERILNLIALSIFLALVVGGLAGSYPSLFLSRFRPVVALKSQHSTKVRARFIQPLVILQFAISAFLIISSVIMYRQMVFISSKDLGYNKEQIVVVPTQTNWDKPGNRVVEQFRTRLEQNPHVISVGATNISFNQGWSRYGYKIKGENRAAYVYSVDPYYIPTLGMELVQGRNFDPSIPSDSNAIIVNEALVKDMGWTDPLSEHLNYIEDSTNLGAKVIGVVKDFHYRSLESPIEPTFLCMDYPNSGYLSSMLIKISADDISTTMENLRSTWNELYPDKPYEYTFLDEDVAKQYESYERWMKIIGFATVFAILISCLGLFGLAGINAVNKTKEVGIRKIFGADISNLFVLLNKQFVVLSLIAFVIAVPFSWYTMNRWLSDFQFHIEMNWTLFALSILVSMGIALITVSYHAIRAALLNPAETLKHE